MARPSSPPILAQIRNSRSSAEQIVALRALKNDIIGHQQKKEMWVRLGVVDPIVRIISTNKAQGKQSNKECRDKSISPEPLSEKEMVRLQALCVIGSLAYGKRPKYLISPRTN
jgi:armadillo repeat-containing protein 8